jgi:hypothetical protein
MIVIDFSNTFVDASGYARENVLRTSLNFNDATMTNLIPLDSRSTGNEILFTDLMCMPS